jgi:hypothetical protein
MKDGSPLSEIRKGLYNQGKLRSSLFLINTVSNTTVGFLRDAFQVL